MDERRSKRTDRVFDNIPMCRKLEADLHNGKPGIAKVPSGSNDDLFVLEYARQKNGWVVSNDKFRAEVTASNHTRKRPCCCHACMVVCSFIRRTASGTRPCLNLSNLISPGSSKTTRSDTASWGWSSSRCADTVLQ